MILDFVMEAKPLTPERQLLNLIEEPQGPRQAIKAELIKRKGLSFLSFGAWAGRFSFFNLKFKDWFKAAPSRRPDIKVINILLGFCALLLGGYFIFTFSAGVAGLKKGLSGLESGSGEAHPGGSSAVKASILRAAAYYLEKARGRDIFQMVRDEEPRSKIVSRSGPPSQRITELIKNLRLVGISWSADPDVMIEDTNTQRTFFLKKGQVIENINVKVEAVFKDKVVLSCDGEEAELR